MRLPRIGADTSKVPGATTHDAFWMLERAVELGLDAVFFRDVTELSASLDLVEIQDVSREAIDRGLAVEVGVGKVNPFATPEDPSIRALGDGDWLSGMQRKLRAAAVLGGGNVWAATANYQFRIRGMYACDRFRTDVTWEEQLRATSKVLAELRPTLIEFGLHLNLETHEEISSFEVVRLIEENGPDAFGVTFDTANVVVRGEDPLAAARRVAPYTRQTHLRDVVLIPNESGLGRLIVPIGTGIIDWDALLAELLTRAPATTYSIEGAFAGTAETVGSEMSLYINDPQWRHSHPDLDDDELAIAIAAGRRYPSEALAGRLPPEEHLRAPVTSSAADAFITTSAAVLRERIATITSLGDSHIELPY